HYPLRVRIGQRLQQHAIDHAKDRAVCSNREPERQDDDHREAKILSERARTVTQVLQEVFEMLCSTQVAALFPDLSHAAKHPRSCLSGLARVHSGGEVFFHLTVDVIAQLSIEFRLRTLAPRQ